MTKLRATVFLVGAALLALVAWSVVRALQDGSGTRERGDAGPAPVQVAPITHGTIEDRRTFSGSLEATAEFVVAPKVGGRIKALTVDLADPVTRGQVVAQLDDDEFRQAVAQAEADLAVAQANLAEAGSSREIAGRELERITTLHERGVASASDLDTARAENLVKQAAVQVAEAQVTRAEASLEAAHIRLGYTTVTADWPNGDMSRVVAARYVDEGVTVAANTPLLSIIELNPIIAVLYVTEKDYANMAVSQRVDLVTDAYPHERFAGAVTRIAPAFQQATRQARVELTVNNADRRLKPGMFVKATVVMQQRADATIVPEDALTSRADESGVFVVPAEGDRVAWRPVAVGIRDRGRVQVTGDGLAGRVVTLGQHMLDDGSAITIPADEGAEPTETRPTDSP